MVDYSEASASSCEKFWLDINFHSLWHVGLFHSRPPKFAVVQLEKKSVFTDIKIDNYLLLVTLLNNLSREVNRLIHLNTNLRLDTDLSRLVTTPSIQMPVTHQGDGVTFAWLDFLDYDFLLFLKVVEVLVLGWDVEVLVFAIAECPVLAVAEIVKVALRVDGDVELAASGDSLDFLPLEGSYLGWFGAGDVGTMAQWSGGVHE